jgi:hypothetical protein
VGNENIIQELKDQSTWRLYGLTMITLGVYWAHYIRRQTNRINALLGEDARISKGLIQLFFIVTYLQLIFAVSINAVFWFMPAIIVEEGHWLNIINIIGSVLGGLWGIIIIAWSFKARNRINTLCSFCKDSEEWFHGFWTFLFYIWYINYKVNVLNESQSLPQ